MDGSPTEPRPLWEEVGAFTTLAVCEGRLLFRDDHFRRWQATLDHLGINARPWAEKLWRTADEMAATISCPALIRVSTTTSVAALHPREVHPSLNPVAGQPVTLSRRLAEWKTLFYSDVLEVIQTTNRATTEPLFCSPERTLLEGATTGIVARSRNTLILPAGPALESITVRRFIAAVRSKYSVITAPLHLDDLAHLDEIIVAGSGRAAIPLHSITGTPWHPKDHRLASQATQWSQLHYPNWW